jgi:hypothetical protein
MVLFLCNNFVFLYIYSTMENVTVYYMYDNTTVFYDYGPAESFSQFMEKHAPMALAIDRAISPIWYVIGVIGNPIATRIWLDRKVRKNNSSAIYLGTLAVVHFFFLFFHLLLELHLAYNVSTINHAIMCEVFNFLYMTLQYYAPLLMLGFTVERYIAVCHPFIKERFCTVSRAVKVCVGLAVLAVLLGSLQIYIWTYYEETAQCGIRPMAAEFYEVWTWVSEMLLFVLVPLTMLVFNVLVIREIRRLTSQGPAVSQGGGGSTSTVTLLTVSFYYICTLLPATIVYSMQSMIHHGDMTLPPEEWATDPTWKSYFTYLTIRKVIEELCLSNYSSYIVIYYITGPHFRRKVNQLFHLDKCCKLIHKSSKSQHSNAEMVTEYTRVACNGTKVSLPGDHGESV